MILIAKGHASVLVPEADDFEIRRGIVGAVKLYFARRRADALLRRTLRPYRAGSAAQLSPHLLRDIGLPPDFPR